MRASAAVTTRVSAWITAWFGSRLIEAKDLLMLSLYQRIKDWQRSPDNEGTGKLARLRDGISAPLAWADRTGRQHDFRQAFSGSPFANFIAEPDGQVSTCNSRFAQLCGLDEFSESSLSMQTLCAGKWTWKAVVDDLECAETPRFRKLTLSQREQNLEVLASLWLEAPPKDARCACTAACSTHTHEANSRRWPDTRRNSSTSPSLRVSWLTTSTTSSPSYSPSASSCW